MSNKITKPSKIVIINGQEIKLNNPDYYRNQQKNWLFSVPQAFYRNSIFLPVSKNKNKVSHESKKTIEVHNLCKFDLYYPVLNQTHANIIDAILYNAIKYIIVENNLWVIVAPSEVMHTLHAGYNYFWLSNKIKEIQESIFIAYDSMKVNQGFPTKQMPLIRQIDDFKGIAQNKYIGFKKTYAPYRIVVFSSLFIYLIRNSLVVKFPKTLIPRILELKHPINQAIARYCLASVNVNENLKRLLVKLGVATGKIERNKQLIQEDLRYKYFSYIKEEQDKLLEYFQIEIKPLKNKELGVFRKVEISDVVRISNPNNDKKNNIK